MSELLKKIDLFVKLATMSAQEALAVLGLPANATPEEINKSYKKQIIHVHPDRLMHLPPEEKEKANSRAVELNVAKDILLNPERSSPFYGDMERNQEVVGDIDDILGREQEKADAWVQDVRKRREWSDYASGMLSKDDLTFEENIAKSPAVEAMREKYRIQREKEKQRRIEKQRNSEKK